ncbi:hypothetical protein I4U23_019909 [Adineta vaga]|nr:hypothetical protein I4U23_019909 [Adineta vaga]
MQVVHTSIIGITLFIVVQICFFVESKQCYECVHCSEPFDIDITRKITVDDDSYCFKSYVNVGSLRTIQRGSLDKVCVSIPDVTFCSHRFEKLIANQIPEECFKRIFTALENWKMTDVRTVPGVMYQVRCGYDEIDPSIEYQINWFIDCTETFIHNHRHSFDTYCLEGEYIEKLWEIIDNGTTDGLVYQYQRNADTTFNLNKILPGSLCHVQTRYHFPGNKLHVDTCQFHSISSVVGSRDRVLTFLVKKNYFPTPEIFALSMSRGIDVQDNEIRPATDSERLAMYEKLHQISRMKIHQ